MPFKNISIMQFVCGRVVEPSQMVPCVCMCMCGKDGVVVKEFERNLFERRPVTRAIVQHRVVTV